MLYRRSVYLVTVVLPHLININDNTLDIFLKAQYLGNMITWDFKFPLKKIINSIKIEPS